MLSSNLSRRSIVAGVRECLFSAVKSILMKSNERTMAAAITIASVSSSPDDIVLFIFHSKIRPMQKCTRYHQIICRVGTIFMNN
jgi:hypothetical protein